MLQLTWMAFGMVIVVSGLWASRSEVARRAGLVVTGVLYLFLGALVNAIFLVRGQDYSGFADMSYLPFVREAWRSIVAPNQYVFISVLVAFEAVVGLLVLRGGPKAELGLLAAIGFHVALLSFGWGFSIWSIPMLVGLVLLLRAQRRSDRAKALTAVPPSRPAVTQ